MRCCLILLLAWLPACGQPCSVPPLTGTRALPGAGEVRFCAPEQLPVKSATAAVLIDDSASMAGHRAEIDRFALWMEQGLSQVRQHGTTYSKTRGCYFSSARPLAGCQDAQVRRGGFRGARDTTLNEAIEYAAQFDLAVILTDGAGATGGGKGDCADGVDAACVARALAAAMRPRPGEPATQLPGLWIVPLVTLYDGKLYTEQPLQPATFDAAKAMANVTRDTGLAAGISEPGSGYRNLFEFHYKGPKTLFAIVLGRPADLGRALLGGLMARREFCQVGWADSPKDYKSGLTAMKPIEVFPGLVPRVQWASARLGEKVCRTMDARLDASQQLTINCPNQVDRGVLRLVGRPTPAGSECAVIQSLPSMPVRVSATRGAAPVEDFRWAGTSTEASRPAELLVRLQCQKAWRFACPAGASVTRWMASRDFSASASRMLAAQPANRAESALFSLSSSEVAYHPHRIFQLRETLEKFYRGVTGLAAEASEEVASLRVCKP